MISGEWRVREKTDSGMANFLATNHSPLATIVTTGSMSGAALQASKLAGIPVYHAPCLSSVDEAFLQNFKAENLFILEENVAPGGYGEAVSSTVMRLGLPIKVHTLALPPRPLPHDTPAAQFASAGLDAEGIADIINGLQKKP